MEPTKPAVKTPAPPAAPKPVVTTPAPVTTPEQPTKRHAPRPGVQENYTITAERVPGSNGKEWYRWTCAQCGRIHMSHVPEGLCGCGAKHFLN